MTTQKNPKPKPTEVKPVKAAEKPAAKAKPAVKAVAKPVVKAAPAKVAIAKAKAAAAKKAPVVKETKPVEEKPALPTALKKPPMNAKAKAKAEKEAELARRLGRARNSLMNAVGEVMKKPDLLGKGEPQAQAEAKPVTKETVKITMKPKDPNAPRPLLMPFFPGLVPGIKKVGKVDLDDILNKKPEETPAPSPEFTFRK